LSTKGLLINSSIQMREQIARSNQAELVALYDTWLLKRKFLSNAYGMSVQQRKTGGIEPAILEKECNQIERELYEKVKESNIAFHRDSIGWTDIRDHLKRGEAAIEIIRTRYFKNEWTDSVLYLALIVRYDQKAQPEAIILENGNELEGKYIKYYQNMIQFKEADLTSYEVYWKKIDRYLDGINRLYISPDGVYNLINLETLYDKERSVFLGENINIQYVTSTKEVVNFNREYGKSNEIAYLFGFPTYDNEKRNENATDLLPFGSSTRFFKGEVIPELPGTREEILSLKKLLDEMKYQNKVFIANEAREESIKSLKRPSILHIATHGYFMDDMDKWEGDSLIMGISALKLSQEPLLRSGLLLADAKKSIKDGRDGILTGYEVLNLDLIGTDMVVLSACETGLGEISNGEGVYGLKRAFRIAGAKSILMTLWKVDDEASNKLITYFYHYWLKKKIPKSKALQKAKNKLRKEYPHPYYWGAFILEGEG